jgi:hypothetical protein
MQTRLPDGDQGFDTLMITSQPCPHSRLQPPVTRTELTEPYFDLQSAAPACLAGRFSTLGRSSNAALLSI